MGDAEMIEIAEIVSSVLHNINDIDFIRNLTKRVKVLCDSFPIYKDWQRTLGKS